MGDAVEWVAKQVEKEKKEREKAYQEALESKGSAAFNDEDLMKAADLIDELMGVPGKYNELMASKNPEDQELVGKYSPFLDELANYYGSARLNYPSRPWEAAVDKFKLMHDIDQPRHPGPYKPKKQRRDRPAADFRGLMDLLNAGPTARGAAKVGSWF